MLPGDRRPPGNGFQLATERFTVSPGTEDQRCYFFERPDKELWVHRFQVALRPGSHLNVFRVSTIWNLSARHGEVVVNGECFISSNWSDWPLVMNEQDSSPRRNPVEWTLPEGVAMKFAPREMLMLQVHYVNATTQQTPGEAWAAVNFWTKDLRSVAAELGTLLATNQNIKIFPGDQDRWYSAACHINGNNPGRTPVTIVAANGHFHSRGTLFTMTVQDANGTPQPAPFYESSSWDEPLFARSLAVQVPPGGSIVWTCHDSMPPNSCGDPTQSCCSTFGPKVETQVHCNAFVYYYPKSQDVICF